MNTLSPHRLRFAIAALIAAAATAHGADEPPALDRETAVKQALRENRQLKVAAFEITAAKVRLKWAGKLGAPEVEVSGNTDQFGLNDGESLIEVGIAQRFPLTDRLKREKALTRVQVALAEAEIGEHRRQLIGKVERAWIAATTALDGVDQLREIQKLHKSHVTILESQAKQGTISRLEVNQAKLDSRALDQKLRSQVAESHQQIAELKTLLGLSVESSLMLEKPGPLSEKTPAAPDPSAALKRRPDFQSIVLKEDESAAELALAESKRWEDVAIRLFAEREASIDEPIGLDRNTFIGVGISIPLPFKKERATAEETVARDRAEATTRAMALEIANEVSAAASHRDELHALAIDASGETVKLAEQNLEEIRQAYQNGQYELIQYQRAQEQLLEARITALDAQAAYHLAEAALREAAATHPRIQPESSEK